MATDLVAFILTHGRPNKVFTYKSLRKHGYTGEIYLIIDDEDDSAPEYRRIYGDKVITFSKTEIAKKFDQGDNFNDRRAIVYARNASFEIANQLGIKYFIQLDDDYKYFTYRFNSVQEYKPRYILNLDRIFEAMLTYYKNTNILSLAMAQGGDYIGGEGSDFSSRLKMKRKAMNSFICSTDRPFKFMGRINEDVNTYTNLGSKGNIFLTIPNISLNQVETQQNSGGMTELYLNSGTYMKSFYSVMYSPSSVKIALMGNNDKRIHHRISWNNTVPAILNEKYKK